MQASETCLNAVKGWEGCKLSIYADLNGFPTIGYGHKLTADEVTSEIYSDGITLEQANELFLTDATPFENAINALGIVSTQGQFDALFSFAYNLGISNMKVMLSHGIDQVPQQISRWTHAGNIVQPGLVARRQQEVEWWNS
jgi:lysozyme